MNFKVHKTAKVIEFFGAPGVGKTYLAKEFVSHCRSTGVACGVQAINISALPASQRVFCKVLYVFLYIVLNPMMTGALFKFVFVSGIRGAKAVTTIVSNWLFVMAVVQWEVRKGDLIVLDQGFAQAYWSMVFRGAQADVFEFQKFINRVLETCGVESLLVVDVACGREEHRVQLASRMNGDSPLDDGDTIKFEMGLQVTESVRKILFWLEKAFLKSEFELLNHENEGNSNIKELCERLLIHSLEKSW
jgi:hypothetical protein